MNPPSFHPGEPPPPELMSFMMVTYGLYAIIAVVFGAYIIVITTVSAFIVPSMALENASVLDAFKRFVAFVRRETLQFFAFVGIRVGLGIVGYIGTTIVYEIVLVLLMLVIGIVLSIFGLVLHLVGIPSTVLSVLGLIVFGTILFSLNLYLLALVLGAFFTFFEAHTLYFLGGRYPMLGELLERSTPASPVCFPPQGYYAAPPPPPPL